MQGIVVASASGDEMLVIVPDPSDPSQVLVLVEFMGLECPPVPVPVQALVALLEALNGKK